MIAFLRLNDEGVDLVGRTPDFQRETVLFVFREVIEMNVHQLRELHELAIQLGFIV